MSNKNQTQKDFYTRMSEWKEQYSSEKVNSLAGEEYIKHLDEINSKSDECRRDNARTIANARNCIVSTPEER